MSRQQVLEYDDPEAAHEEQLQSVEGNNTDDLAKQYDLDSTVEEEDSLSYVDGGWYFPQCFGVVTIAYIVYAIVIVTVIVPRQPEPSSELVFPKTSTVWWMTDLWVAVVAFFLALQLVYASSNSMASMALGGWSVGFAIRGVLSAVICNTSINDNNAVMLYHVGTAVSYSIWAIALFFILQILTESWNAVKFAILEAQGLEGIKHRRRTSLWSWINVARVAFAMASVGAMIVLAGSLWIVVVSLVGQTTDNMIQITSTLIQIGQGMVVASYLIFFMAAAILWGCQARMEEVFLTDFFLPPQVAVSGMLWCMILSGLYRIVSLILDGDTNTDDDNVKLNEILAPLILQYMTLATMVFCHNLIVSFFPNEHTGDTDDDDDESYYGAMADHNKLLQFSFDEHIQGDYDDDEELNRYLRPGEEVLGYHYELENNSLEDNDNSDTKQPKRRRSFGFRRNRTGNGSFADTKLSTDAVKVLFGDNKDSFESDDEEDEEVGKIAASGHVYGKYDNFVFGEDAHTNISMLPKKADGTPDLAGFDRRSKMDKELDQTPDMSPVDFLKSLSILPTTVADRDDDGSIESAQVSSRSNQSAINNRSSPSLSIGMDGQVLPNEHGKENGDATEHDGHPPIMAVTVADFMSALSPWTAPAPTKAINHKKQGAPTGSKKTKTRKACSALDVSKEFNDGIQAVASTLSDIASGCLEKGLNKPQKQSEDSSIKKRNTIKHGDESTGAVDSDKTAPVSLEAKQSAPTAVGLSVFESMASAMQNVDNLWTSWMNTAATSDATNTNKNGGSKDSVSTKSKLLSQAQERPVNPKPTTEEEHSQSTCQSSTHLPIRNLVVEKSGDEESLRFHDDEIGSFTNDGYYEDVIVLDANGRPTLGPNVRNLVQYWDLGKANADGADVVKNNNHTVVRTRTLESKEGSKKSKKYRSAFGSLKRGMKRMGSRTRSRSRSLSKSPIYEHREDNIIGNIAEADLRRIDSRDTDVGLVVHHY